MSSSTWSNSGTNSWSRATGATCWAGWTCRRRTGRSTMAYRACNGRSYGARSCGTAAVDATCGSCYSTVGSCYRQRCRRCRGECSSRGSSMAGRTRRWATCGWSSGRWTRCHEDDVGRRYRRGSYGATRTGATDQTDTHGQGHCNWARSRRWSRRSARTRTYSNYWTSCSSGHSSRRDRNC